MLAALMAALLSTASPAFQLAQADTAPPAAAAAVAAGPDVQDDLPAGAPTDDYGLVAWCYGALSRHMELRERVWPEVQKIEAEFPEPGVTQKQALAGYDAQRKAGLSQLDLYGRALSLAEATHPGLDRKAAIQVGRDAWKGADQTDTHELARSWMDWALPAACPETAHKMLGK